MPIDTSSFVHELELTEGAIYLERGCYSMKSDYEGGGATEHLSDSQNDKNSSTVQLLCAVTCHDQVEVQDQRYTPKRLGCTQIKRECKIRQATT